MTAAFDPAPLASYGAQPPMPFLATTSIATRLYSASVALCKQS